MKKALAIICCIMCCLCNLQYVLKSNTKPTHFLKIYHQNGYKNDSNDNNNNNKWEPYFVPFPHNNVGIGKYAKCKWTTLGYFTALSSPLSKNDGNNPQELIMQKLLKQDIDSPDKIQKTALSDSICLKTNKNDNFNIIHNDAGRYHNNFHLFSTDEARSCLKDKTLIITGDSYSQQLFIGLCEIMLGRPSSYEIWGSKVRQREYRKHQRLMNEFQNNNTELGLDISLDCITPCYGQASFSYHCHRCLHNFFDKKKEENRYNNNNKAGMIPIPVVGAMVHIHTMVKVEKGTGKAVADVIRKNETLKQITDFFDNMKYPLIYASQPKFDLTRTPEIYKEITDGREKVYFDLIKILPEYKQKVNFIDFYQMTEACQWKNCTSDGSHRSRFVNRWKAQTLLNTLCSFSV